MDKSKKPDEWLTRNAIATRMGMALSLVQRHMARPDAPAPRKSDGLYAWLKSEAFLQKVTKWARGGLSDGAQAMKDEMVALDLEAKREAAAVRRGELVNKKSMADAITALGRELFAMIKQKYVDELPTKYLGKNEVECRFLNESAFNEISMTFRAGAKRVEGK